MVIPTGFRFCPTEEELINSYLRPHIMGQVLPCNIVEEKRLYGVDDPWNVLPEGNNWLVSEVDKLGNTVKKKIYVFTKLTKKAAAGKMRKNSCSGKEQFVRAAGCGAWDGQTGPREVKGGNGEVIGFKKMLVFEIRSALNPSPNPSNNAESTCANPGHWIMHEYSLPGDESDYVICEIILNLKKKSKRKRGVVEEDEKVVINPKRLMKIDEEKKDGENVIICCSDVPGEVDHELMPMIEYSQDQTLDQWDDFINVHELLDSKHEVGPFGMEYSQVPHTVESQQDDFINLDELLDSEVPNFGLLDELLDEYSKI